MGRSGCSSASKESDVVSKWEQMRKTEPVSIQSVWDPGTAKHPQVFSWVGMAHTLCQHPQLASNGASIKSGQSKTLSRGLWRTGFLETSLFSILQPAECCETCRKRERGSRLSAGQEKNVETTKKTIKKKGKDTTGATTDGTWSLCQHKGKERMFTKAGCYTRHIGRAYEFRNIYRVTFLYLPPWPGKQSWVFPGKEEKQNPLQQPVTRSSCRLQTHSQVHTTTRTITEHILLLFISILSCMYAVMEQSKKIFLNGKNVHQHVLKQSLRKHWQLLPTGEKL